MVRTPGDVTIGGIEFDRPELPRGLTGLPDRVVREANRPFCAVPGGGFLDWRGHSDRWVRRPRGGTYHSLSPFDDVIAARVIEDFNVCRRSSGASVSTFESMPGPRDRSYGWRVDCRIEDAVTGEFLESQTPDSVDKPDSQAGLDEFAGPVDPCPPDEIRSCDCCRCIHCDSKATRARVTKSPTFACGNPSCDGDPFERPVVKPGRRGA